MGSGLSQKRHLALEGMRPWSGAMSGRTAAERDASKHSLCAHRAVGCESEGGHTAIGRSGGSCGRVQPRRQHCFVVTAFGNPFRTA